MTLVAVPHLVRSVNRRIAFGRSIAVLAFQTRDTTLVDRTDIHAYLGAHVRNGDLFAYRAGDDTYVVACTGTVRDAQDDTDGGAEAAARRIGGTLRERTGAQFTGAWKRFSQATTGPQLWHSLRMQLASQAARQTALARIAHELRSPLASIHGYLELLEGCAAPMDGRAFVRTARAEAQRLGRMLDGMVEFSLLDACATRGERTCDVAAAIQRAVEVVRPRSLRCGTQVCIPRWTQRRAFVAVDDCVRAISNLLDNAIDAGARTVHVGSFDREGVTFVTVDDDGPGVPVSERRAIFECGYRGSVGRNYRGSGFGLASVRAIVESYDGRITVGRSRFGGARFSMRFPSA